MIASKHCSILLTFLFCILSATVARAHRVTVFAWVEGDTVFTQSKFPGGKAVNHGTIKVYDPRENLVLEGTTDDQGEFSFKAPKKEDLTVVIEAGMGHRGKWTVRADEIAGVDGNTQPAEPPATVEPSMQPEKEYRSDAEPSPAGTEPDVRQIETVVEKVLDKKLKPVIKMLADSEQAGPTLQDILAGLGYILGLVGLGTFFHYRRKIKELKNP